MVAGPALARRCRVLGGSCLLKDRERYDLYALAAIPQHIGFAAPGEMNNPAKPVRPVQLGPARSRRKARLTLSPILNSGFIGALRGRPSVQRVVVTSSIPPGAGLAPPRHGFVSCRHYQRPYQAPVSGYLPWLEEMASSVPENGFVWPDTNETRERLNVPVRDGPGRGGSKTQWLGFHIVRGIDPAQ